MAPTSVAKASSSFMKNFYLMPFSSALKNLGSLSLIAITKWKASVTPIGSWAPRSLPIQICIPSLATLILPSLALCILVATAAALLALVVVASLAEAAEVAAEAAGNPHVCTLKTSVHSASF